MMRIRMKPNDIDKNKVLRAVFYLLIIFLAISVIYFSRYITKLPSSTQLETNLNQIERVTNRALESVGIFVTDFSLKRNTLLLHEDDFSRGEIRYTINSNKGTVDIGVTWERTDEEVSVTEIRSDDGEVLFENP
jgi:hypothetical protein